MARSMDGTWATLGAVAAIGAFTVIRRGSRAKSTDRIMYHLTNRAKFKLDSKFMPADNSFSIEDRSGLPGIYLGKDVGLWLQGFGYWRPFVVEFKVDPLVEEDPGVHGRWGGELFIPASSFDKITLQRVIPLDAVAREEFGQHGWVESWMEKEFDTGKPITAKLWEYPFRGWRYPGPDVRDMSKVETRRLKGHLARKVKG